MSAAIETSGSEVRIRLKDVSLEYPIFDSGGTSIRNQIVRIGSGGLINRHAHSISVRALDHISLEIEDGDRIALIGRNGAGKTTLLRVLAGIFTPTEGTIERRGKVSCLLAAGLGMEPDATGRENIYLAGLALGIAREQVDEIVDEVEEFVELGEFLDLPVRTYSSGMGMRLSFAVATAVDPGILLVDELIGVGDREFYEKASTRLEHLLRQSRVLVMASHDMEVVNRFCSKAVLLQHGRLLAFGSVEDVVKEYANLAHG